MASRLYYLFNAPPHIRTLGPGSPWGFGQFLKAFGADGTNVVTYYGRMHQWPNRTSGARPLVGPANNITYTPFSQPYRVYQLASQRLSGNQSIAGTVKGQIYGLTSNASMNVQLIITLRVVTPAGGTRGTLLASYQNTTNLTTTGQNRRLPPAATAIATVNALDGDFIVAEIGFTRSVVAATITFPSTAYATVDAPEDDTTTTVGRRFWLEFSQTLTFGVMQAAKTYSLPPRDIVTSAAAVDSTAPTVTGISPAAGAISTSQALAATIADETTLTRAEVLILYTNIGRYEVAHDGASFDTRYSAGSTLTGTNTKTLSLVRTGGWPDSFTMRIIAVDAAGNVTTSNTAYTVASYVPSVSNVVPAVGAIVHTSTIAFRVSDPTALGRVIVSVDFGDETENVYDGSSFEAPYAAASSVVAGSAIYDFTLSRTPAWSGNPTVDIVAIDADGNVVNTSLVYTLSTTAVPTVTSVVPAEGSTLEPADTIAFTAYALFEIRRVVVSAAYATLGRSETIYDGSAFLAPYLALSSAVPTGSTTLAFTLARTGGWPDDAVINVTIVDEEGNVFTDALSYNVNVAVEVDPPVIADISPAPNAALRPTESISLTVSDDVEVLACIILAYFEDANELYEVVYDNEGFSAAYADDSSVELTGDTIRAFTLTRRDGWPCAPEFNVIVTDRGGNLV